MRRSSILLLIVLTALSACGVRRDIKPKVGQALPVAPYGRADRPASAELLTPTSRARPGRNVELRERSEPRTDDPYDLPPSD
jgi:hypothetical protein